MSNLEQLLFERYQRWAGARVNLPYVDVSRWNEYRRVKHRTELAWQDWQACKKRNDEMEKNGTAENH